MQIKAKYKLESNKVYPVETIHFDTKQVTLRQKRNVYNTVFLKHVELMLFE